MLGNITIGDGSKVGGGAVVVNDVPPNSTVVGIPGRVVVRDGHRVESEAKDAAQHKENLPDPIEERCANQCERIEALERRLKELEEQKGRS